MNLITLSCGNHCYLKFDDKLRLARIKDISSTREISSLLKVHLEDVKYRLYPEFV
jgi:hypothetical protein